MKKESSIIRIEGKYGSGSYTHMEEEQSVLQEHPSAMSAPEPALRESASPQPVHLPDGQASPAFTAPGPATEEHTEEARLVTTAQIGHAMSGAHLRSKKALFRIGLTIALLNPVLSGIILGVYFWREPELRREGKIITVVSLVWGALILVAAFASPAKGLSVF